MVFSKCFSGQDYLSACAIFQDEAPYLKEWIEYHRLLGVKKFYLYNDNSTDNYQEILRPYIRNKVVKLVDWPRPQGRLWHDHQVAAYNHCIRKCKKNTFWLAVIDIDEFIVPVKEESLPQFLKKFEWVGGVQIFWQFFGTSGVYEVPKDKTLIETLVRKARKDHTSNYNFKTICQVKAIKKFFVHAATYHKPWYGLFPHGARGGANQTINIDRLRIHHYWTRDEKYFREKKIPRKKWMRGVEYTEERIQKRLRDLNQIEDRSILRFVPALRARLGL